MKSTLLRRFGAVLVLALSSGPAAAAGQSLFGATGLGVPIDALDARTRALGSSGPGLFGSGFAMTDPASLAQVVLPTITVTMQPTWGEYERTSATGDLQGTRFPVIGVAYPLGSVGVFSVGMGSFLDQRWAAERAATFTIGGVPVAGTDRFESEGGVSQVQLGWGRRMTERVGVGAAIGRFAGRVDRSFTRTFDTASSAAADVAPFLDAEAWTYGGTHLTVGATFDPIAQVRLGGSFRWAGTLEADPTEETSEGLLTFDLPTELRLGASAALTTRVMATVGLRMSDWSGVDPVLDTTSATGQTLDIGGGIEWGGPNMFGRTMPVRIGYRRSELPFGAAGSDPVETATSFGVGLNLAQVEEFPLAALDLTVERGTRTGPPLEERFWRGSLTLKVSGR